MLKFKQEGLVYFTAVALHSQHNHFDWIFNYSLHGFNLTAEINIGY